MSEKSQKSSLFFAFPNESTFGEAKDTKNHTHANMGKDLLLSCFSLCSVVPTANRKNYIIF